MLSRVLFYEVVCVERTERRKGRKGRIESEEKNEMRCMRGDVLERKCRVGTNESIEQRKRKKKKKSYGLFVFIMASMAPIDQWPVAQTPTHWIGTPPPRPLPPPPPPPRPTPGRCGTPIFTNVLARRFAIRFSTMKDSRLP